MPLWQELSLLREHALYVDKALALMDQASAFCARWKMQLQLALGSLTYHARVARPAPSRRLKTPSAWRTTARILPAKCVRSPGTWQ
jgi:hypothetical protein